MWASQTVEKLLSEPQQASGHDFSRAVTGSNSARASAPEGTSTFVDLNRRSLNVRVLPMMMVMVVVVMRRGSERRAGKHHQEQDGGKNPLHAKNVPRSSP